jgi:hypothetical protein
MIGLRKYGLGTMAFVFAQDYALNLVQAWVFRRAGFLASILVRKTGHPTGRAARPS